MADKLGTMRRWLLIGATMLIAVPALVAGVVYSSALRTQVVHLRISQLDSQGLWAGDQIVLRLDQLWQQIAAMSRKIDLGKLDGLREQLTLITQIDDRFSWIGVADRGGTVLISSNGLLEGASVARRPWFMSGLSGPFAGDVHEAVLLENLLPKRDEPYRFIDFSAPIRNGQGEVVGVLGAHFDWVWIMKLVDSFRSDNEDAVLLSDERRVLHGPAGLHGQQLTRTSSPFALSGKAGAHLEQWPDGGLYVTQTVPLRTKAGAPTFGWSLAIRSDAAAVFRDSSGPLRTFWVLLGGALIVMLSGTTALIAWMAAPRRLIGACGLGGS